MNPASDRSGTSEQAYRTRIERLMGAPLAQDAVRRWPQSGEILRGSDRIAEVESHFPGLKLGVVRRHRAGDLIVVEWVDDYGDGRIYHNVSLGELRDGIVVRVTDYWGEPFTPPVWREGLSERDSERADAEAMGSDHPEVHR